MKRRSATQIPPRGLVRAVAAIMLLVGLMIIYIGVINFTGFWLLPSIGILIVGCAASGTSTMSLITGDPEWILLDLILSY